VPAAIHGGGRFYNFLKECFMKKMVFCVIPVMYNNLYLKGLADLKTGRYWTSFAGYKDDVLERIFYIDFSDSSEKNFSMIWNLPAARCQVRAVRQF
jgi:hypothetical protein